MRVMPLLRALGRPFAVLAAWLVVVGTVLPYTTSRDGPLCLAGDAGGLPTTHCDACLAVAVLPQLPAVPRARHGQVRVAALTPAAAANPAAQRWSFIRGPPRA